MRDRDTGRGGARTSVERALRGLLWDKVPRDHRQDPRPFLVRRVVTAVFVVIGAVVLGWSLQIDAGRLDVLRRDAGAGRGLDRRRVRVGTALPRPGRPRRAPRRPAPSGGRRGRARPRAGRRLRRRRPRRPPGAAHRPADQQRARPRRPGRHAPAGAHHRRQRDRRGAVLPGALYAASRATRSRSARSRTSSRHSPPATSCSAFAAILLGVVVGLERRASGGVIAWQSPGVSVAVGSADSPHRARCCSAALA